MQGIKNTKLEITMLTLLIPSELFVVKFYSFKVQLKTFLLNWYCHQHMCGSVEWLQLI